MRRRRRVFSRRRPVAFANDLDYLVSVMPNTAGTRHLVDASLLAALPQRAVFINPGRGSVVDERALADALQSGRLAAPCSTSLSRTATGPIMCSGEHQMCSFTAHTAAVECARDIAPVFVDNYRRWTAGEPLRYQVDFVAGY